MNQTGQAFSVFKLLIAAVVAVVILTLLLSIIGQINIFGQGDPGEESAKLVNTLANSRGRVAISGQVVFSGGNGISNRAIADETRGSISANQVCVVPGDFFEEADDTGLFTFTDGISLTYNGSSPRSAQIVAICDTGREMADDDYFNVYTGFTDDEGSGGINPEWVDDEICGCLGSRQTCCVVALKQYRG
jgi:hypothetical protein